MICFCISLTGTKHKEDGVGSYQHSLFHGFVGSGLHVALTVTAPLPCFWVLAHVNRSEEIGHVPLPKNSIEAM